MLLLTITTNLSSTFDSIRKRHGRKELGENFKSFFRESPSVRISSVAATIAQLHA